MNTTPVGRPLLPDRRRLEPYLDAIDRTRTYGNYGPLSLRFEERLAERFGLSREGVIAVANGTVGLTMALMVQGAAPGKRCLMPAWTFAATAHAALMAGLVPYFLDVEEGDWSLSHEAVERAWREMPSEIGAVIAVAPFGQPIGTARWDAFAARTGVPVVFDAAAAFDAWQPTRSPAVISLHATKILGVGEGGLVLSTSPELIWAVRRAANFGFSGTRQAVCPATNGKMSEYHAAVGLAGLDDWAAIRGAFQRVAATYRRALRELGPTAELQTGYGSEWVAATCNVRLHGAHAEPIGAALARHGIDSRRWWGDGLHRHPAFVPYPRGDLRVTERIAEETLGLPCFPDLPEAEIGRICRTMNEATSSIERLASKAAG